MSAPASRTVHPCVVSLTDGTRGVEHSCWAYLEGPRHGSAALLPNLVTAAASTLTVYRVNPQNGRLSVAFGPFTNLAGTVSSLHCLPSAAAHSRRSKAPASEAPPVGGKEPSRSPPSSRRAPDALLVGFAGEPRWSVVTVAPDRLRAECLLDLTPLLQETAQGAVEHADAVTAVSGQFLGARSGEATMACILGAGVAVAIATVRQVRDRANRTAAWVIPQEPFVLPLYTLAKQLPHVTSQYHHYQQTLAMQQNQQQQPHLQALGAAQSAFGTGFGDIMDATFLTCYTEPVLVLLHSSPGGRVFEGRLGRPDGAGGVAQPYRVTALSVSVAHGQGALLWTQAVGVDAFRIQAFAGTKCLVLGVNTLTILDPTGAVEQVLAMNGWARATSPSSLLSRLEPNPLLRLAVALDGSAWTWLDANSQGGSSDPGMSASSSTTALVALRRGQLYTFQQLGRRTWSLLPTGQALGGIGQIEHLMALPLHKPNTTAWVNKLGGEKMINMSMGLVFAASRLGNSLLLGYALESISMPREVETLKLELTISVSPPETTNSGALEQLQSQPLLSVTDEDYDRILRLEEEALYGPVGDGNDLRAESNLATVNAADAHDSNRGTKRQRQLMFSVVRALTPLDSLVNLGPLGEGSEGPVAPAPAFMMVKGSGSSVRGIASSSVFGSSALVYPCGFGSSGGVAVVSAPGRDDRVILGEHDCLNVESVFSLPMNNLLLLGMSEKASGGIRVLNLERTGATEYPLQEIDITMWNDASSGGEIFESAADVFMSTLLLAGEFADGSTCFVVSTPSVGGMPAYFIAILKKSKGNLTLHKEIMLDSSGEYMCQVTPFLTYESSQAASLTFACIWSSGRAETFLVSSQGLMSKASIDVSPNRILDPMDVDNNNDDDLRPFYNDSRIVGIDVFMCQKSLILSQEDTEDVEQSTPWDPSQNDGRSAMVVSSSDEENDDDEETELYSTSQRSPSIIPRHHESGPHQILNDEEDDGMEVFVAVCRQSGKLEIFSFEEDYQVKLCRAFGGCGQGADRLQDASGASSRLPRSHSVAVKEMRFFYCGTSSKSNGGIKESLLCLAIETSAGDLQVYAVDRQPKLSLRKILSRSVLRPSQEQNRHHMKLVRRRIVDKSAEKDGFAFVRLHRFSGVSGLDGLFAACTQAAWIIPERGAPRLIVHRTRHAAPAGGKPRPVSGFCSILLDGMDDKSGYITLHERVGRVGSQRLSVFQDLSPIFYTQGLLTGHSGYCAEKIQLGVTVRAVCFIDDGSSSSQEHPLYAMIVSRELEADQSDINNDGLTPEERQQMEEEKMAAKIKKQVEADLGGFELDTEWVEEIERENCFKVDENLGGAPPVQTQAFSLWIVDAANGWIVVDSFELDEFEHAMTMKVMRLTDFPEEPGSSEEDQAEMEQLTHRLFIAVGTGVVNHNGEDVASRGRMLLFDVARPSEASLLPADVATLSLKYEKNIFHGPVTSLSCLTAEGRHRLVIGAGADVNVEQWGGDRLTQVGFFRATMHILDILHFKSFMLLSDAYDSLHFLVWRESDKSLTLLAKDYDPIAVHGTGLLGRGASVAFVCQDDRQNLQFFQYAPGDAAARGGNKLVCRADVHLGAQAAAPAMTARACRSSLTAHSATPRSTLAALRQQDAMSGKGEDDQKMGAFFGTTDGTLIGIVPLSEPVFWRLMALQSVMANALEGDCGMNQRAWRLYRRSPRRGGCRSHDRKKGVIDGDFLMQFVDLSLVDQEDLASAIGSTVDLILDNLLEIQCNRMII